MALVQADRVKETTTTTGTGAVSLAGAASGFRSFSSVLANGDSCSYVIVGGTEWEVGVGTYATTGNTLTRTTITASSNGGSAVSFSAGTKEVFIASLASDPAFSSPIRVPAGSVSSAAVQSNLDPNTGIIFPAADTISLVAGGNSGISVTSLTATVNNPLQVTAGSVTAAAIFGPADPNTGVIFPAPDTLALVEGGVEVLRINSSSEVVVGNGDESATPAPRTIRGTNGSGNNVAAATLTISPGLGTGNASAASVRIMTSQAESSGSTLHTSKEVARFEAGTLSLSPFDVLNDFAYVRPLPKSGTNAPATQLWIEGGEPTGAGLPGRIVFATSTQGASGTTLRQVSERGSWSKDGEFVVGGNDLSQIASPLDGVIRGSNATGFTGDVPGGNLTIRSGQGAGAVGSYIRFVTSQANAGGLQPTAEAMRIDSEQRVLINLNSANANGGVLQLMGGITFPATAVPSSDANTLDDYEEGTWTPNVTGGTTAGNYVETVAAGMYTRVGRVVHVSARITIATAGNTAGSGNLRILGLPFVADATGDYVGSGYISLANTSHIIAVPIVRVAQPYIEWVSKTASATSWTNTPVTYVSTLTGTIIFLSASYIVA